VAAEREAIADGAQEEDQKKSKDPNDYYFRDNLRADFPAEIIQKIREAEASILLQKKQMYLNFLKEEVKQKEAEAQENQDNPDAAAPAGEWEEKVKKATVRNWQHPIKTREVDMYFCLLVYSLKPEFSTCAALFDKFEEGGPDGEAKDYLTLQEWEKLCARVQVRLPDAVRVEIWNLLSWRSRLPEKKDGKQTVPMTDFIAGWHVHDIENKDPFIAPITTLLQLEYYLMDIEELNGHISERVQGIVPIGNNDPAAAEDESDHGDVIVDVNLAEGEWRAKYKAHDKLHAQGAKHEPRTEYEEDVKVSMTNEEKHDKDRNQDPAAVADDLVDDSDVEIDSSDLSDPSSASEEVFFALKLAEGDAVESSSEEEDANPQDEFKVQDDATLKQLMFMSPHQVLPKKKGVKKVVANVGDKPKATLPDYLKRKAKKASRGSNHDGRFQSDVTDVRKDIRSNFRCMRKGEFVQLAGFILRGLRLVKSQPGISSYWHVDDPVFKHCMGDGSNPYPFQLLKTMGFVMIRLPVDRKEEGRRAGRYWVWPTSHLRRFCPMGELDQEGGDPEMEETCWGKKLVKKDSPGRTEERLNDMIKLFKGLQRAIVSQGEAFNGAFG